MNKNRPIPTLKLKMDRKKRERKDRRKKKKIRMQTHLSKAINGTLKNGSTVEHQR
jgi:hypothetical protein